MRFDKGTLGIVAAAVLLAVVLSSTGGALLGVFAAVVAGVAATALWQLRLNWLAGAARKAELEKTQAKYVLPGPALEGGVARLLRPEEEVVRFRPRPELDQLISWAVVSEAHAAVQLVTGAGGTGKTRLARQLVHEIAGWRTQWVSPGSEREAAGTAKAVGEPVLLVVDYAETRTGLQELLAEVTSDTDGPDMRVLLLARSAGEWWRQLITNSEYQLSELLAAVQPIMLGAVSDSYHQPEVFHEALAAFAYKLGVECPDAEVALADPDAVVLAIHAAALLAVLDHSSANSAEPAPHSVADAFAGLLRHEARYWQQSQTARGLRLDSEVTRRVVAAGCLVGADDEAAANKLLASIADLADSATLRGQAARWLHDLYPAIDGAPEGEWIGPLQPDLLAEQLVVSVLSEQPDLISALLTGQPEWRAFRALTLLARAAYIDPLAADQLDLALQSDPENLVFPALAVAVETNPAVGGMIKNAVASSNLSYHMLEHIIAALPHESLALTEASVVVSQRLVDGSESGSPERGVWLVFLSNWLSDLERREEALAAIEEAVAIDRALAQTRPDEFLPGLATSLNNLADRLSDLGRREEALSASEEAVTINRSLAQSQPDEFLSSLAFSLDCLSITLSDLGREDEALVASKEAVTINRALAQSQPGKFLPDLAFSLNRHSGRLSDLGQEEEALAASDEAVVTFRQLAQTRPDAYLSGLSSVLNNQANYLSALGRREEALAASKEAVTIRRALVHAWPDAFMPNLAMSLHNQSSILSKLDRPEEALAASEEAVAAYRQLAQARPDAFLHELAMALRSLSIRLSDLERPEEALTVSEEAVTICRTLAQASPDAFLPDLASARTSQSKFLSDLERPDEALTFSEEAVTIYRTLAQRNPGAFLPRLALALNNQVKLLSDLGREGDALSAVGEAVSIFRPRAQASPGAYLPNLAMSLHNRSNVLSNLDRPEEALAASEEAAAIYRQLNQASPAAFLDELAVSLNSLATIFTVLNRESDADVVRAEAARLNQNRNR